MSMASINGIPISVLDTHTLILDFYQDEKHRGVDIPSVNDLKIDFIPGENNEAVTSFNFTHSQGKIKAFDELLTSISGHHTKIIISSSDTDDETVFEYAP